MDINSKCCDERVVVVPGQDFRCILSRVIPGIDCHPVGRKTDAAALAIN